MKHLSFFRPTLRSAFVATAVLGLGLATAKPAAAHHFFDDIFIPGGTAARIAHDLLDFAAFAPVVLAVIGAITAFILIRRKRRATAAVQRKQESPTESE